MIFNESVGRVMTVGEGRKEEVVVETVAIHSLLEGDWNGRLR